MFNNARRSNNRRFAWVTLVPLALSLVGLPRFANAQFLQSLRSEVREPPVVAPPSDPPPQVDDDRRRRNRDRCDDDWDDDDVWKEGLGWLALGAITSPIWAPIGIAGDHYDQRSYFAPVPYHRGHNGLMVRSQSILEETTATQGFPYSARFRTDYGEDNDGLSQTRIHGLIDTATRWGVDGAVVYRHQPLAGGGDDELLTGDLNILFRFAQSPWLQMRTGLGVNFFDDETSTEAGFNFTYGGDLFLKKPFVLSAEIDAGSLGDSGLFHFRTTIGATKNGVEVYTGYDHYDVDSLESDQWIFGVGVWF